MNKRTLMLTTFLALAACDGPHEDAGERIDAQRGVTGGESSMISGPAKRAGEERDRREEAARAANRSKSDGE